MERRQNGQNTTKGLHAIMCRKRAVSVRDPIRQLLIMHNEEKVYLLDKIIIIKDSIFVIIIAVIMLVIIIIFINSTGKKKYTVDTE